MTKATKLLLVFVITTAITIVGVVGAFGTAMSAIFSPGVDDYASAPVEPETEVVDETTTGGAEGSEETTYDESEDALYEAQSVVDLGGPISRVALYDMLGTTYGMGFSDEDVQYAIDNVEVDWGDSATGTAEIYLEGYPEATADEVFDFLVDPEINGFTDEEAEQAIGQLGLLS